MQVKAKAKYIRISPRKMRKVVDAIRNSDLNRAFNILTLMRQKSVRPVEKVLKSALSNAIHNYNLEKENLYIKEIKVDSGSTLHRWMPRAFGRATPIRKRSSMVSVILEEKVEKKDKDDKKITENKAVKAKKAVAGQFAQQNAVDAAADKKEQEEKGKEIFDVRMKGKHRHLENSDKIKGKKEKGIIKNIFRRKAGM